MTRHHTRTGGWGGLCAVSLLAASGLWSPAAEARDINRQRYLIGERAGGMGGAFVAMTGDAASAWYNPAGLAALREKGVSLSASAYQLATERHEGILSIGDPTQRASIYADAEGSQFSTFPSSIIYTTPISDDGGTHHVLAFAVLVPDYDRMNLRINRPPNLDVPFEFAGRFYEERSTYWVGPSYAFERGPWRVGFSAYALAHFLDSRSSIGLKSRDVNTGDNAYVASTMELSAMAVTSNMQIGVQYAIDPELTVGVNLRSGTLGALHDSGEYLLFRSVYGEDAQGSPLTGEGSLNAVDRFETDLITADYRLPPMIAVGVAKRRADTWSLAADLTLHLPLSAYDLYSGPVLYALDPQGQPILDADRAVKPQDRRQYSAEVNLNVGGEVLITEGWWLRGGVFTDRSTVDQGYFDTPDRRLDAFVLPEVNRYGVSLGLGSVGEKSTTSLNVVYVFGTGSGFDLDSLFGLEGGSTDVTSQTLTLTLAGSADL